jgi:hypothetical protein
MMIDDRLPDELERIGVEDPPISWPSSQPRAVSRPDLNDPQRPQPRHGDVVEGYPAADGEIPWTARRHPAWAGRLGAYR